MSTVALSGVYSGLVEFFFPRLQPSRNLLDLDSALLRNADAVCVATREDSTHARRESPVV